MNGPRIETLAQRMDRVIVLAVVTIFLLMSSKLTLAQPSISNLWKARALAAADKMEILSTKLNKVQKSEWNSKEAKRIRCEIMVEFAYGMQVAQEDIVHKFDKGNEFFHFILNGGPEAGLFDLVYVYSAKGEFILARIDEIPKKWHLIFLIPGKAQLLMPNDDCLFEFDLDDPFAAKLLD